MGSVGSEKMQAGQSEAMVKKRNCPTRNPWTHTLLNCGWGLEKSGVNWKSRAQIKPLHTKGAPLC